MLSSSKNPNVLQVTSREGMLYRLKESEVIFFYKLKRISWGMGVGFTDA